ncbi:MAG: LysR family transcriptional regulator [Acetobacteraceae bacterium]
MDDLRDLSLFVAVAESHSFTRASSRLGIPTSTVSRRIADLESSLGFRLFNRTTRTVELTEAGRLYFGRCQAIVEEARNARDEMRAQLGSPQGLLRISVETEVGPRLVRPVIKDYLGRYPRVSIELDVSPRRVDLVAEGFDIVLRIGRLSDSSLTVRRLAVLGAHLFAAPGYLQRHGTPADPSALATHRRIHLIHRGDDGAWSLSRQGETFEVKNNGGLSTNSMSMARSFALDQLGIAVLDEFLAFDDVRTGELVRVLADWCLRKYPISVLTPSRFVPIKSRLFMDLLTDQIATTPGLERA